MAAYEQEGRRSHHDVERARDHHQNRPGGQEGGRGRPRRAGALDVGGRERVPPRRDTRGRHAVRRKARARREGRRGWHRLAPTAAIDQLEGKGAAGRVNSGLTEPNFLHFYYFFITHKQKVW